MRTLIIHDSLYGNTEKIAREIGNHIPLSKVISVKEAVVSDLKSIDLLIIGSPVHGGRPKQDLQSFLNQIPKNGLKDVSVAVFDTRFLEKNQNFALKLLMKAIGYAAPKIAETLKNNGARLTSPPQGFIVNGKSGPLADGELERAKSWAMQLIKK